MGFMSCCMNDQSNQPHMLLNRSYGAWPQHHQQQIPMAETPRFQSSKRQSFGGGSNWNAKKQMIEKSGFKHGSPSVLQSHNGQKARRFHPKRFSNRFAPFAPRNTTSFIIRAKKSGGIASLVSPCPVTPAILPTPVFSPSREGLRDMAKEEWGVDDYGSMNGLIRLRMRGNDGVRGEEDYEEGGSSESDLEEHVEVERRLDHDLSRFEMIYPASLGDDQANAVQNGGDDQDSHVTQLAEENLTVKERLFLMEKELGDLRRRLVRLEAELGLEKNNHNEEEESDNDGCGDVCSEKSVGDVSNAVDDSALIIVEQLNPGNGAGLGRNKLLLFLHFPTVFGGPRRALLCGAHIFYLNNQVGLAQLHLQTL